MMDHSGVHQLIERAAGWLAHAQFARDADEKRSPVSYHRNATADRPLSAQFKPCVERSTAPRPIELLRSGAFPNQLLSWRL
ncbi:MAG: hypothetical protein Q8K82_06930 [Gemmatimonadaceae bacterium]|nr:hypothetical protein [Gemmatimonadaceae bacterium]